MNLALSEICVVYPGLCIYTAADLERYLHRAGPRVMGHMSCVEGYDRAIEGYGPGLRGDFQGTVPHDLQPPQADNTESRDHVHTLQSCHGTVIASLSEVPQEGSPAFPLFPLVRLNLASHPLPRSYSRVNVSKNNCLIFLCPYRLDHVKRQKTSSDYDKRYSKFSLYFYKVTTYRPFLPRLLIWCLIAS